MPTLGCGCLDFVCFLPLTLEVHHWPWPFHHSKCAGRWDTHEKTKKKYKKFFLTFDLKGWPWNFTTQNVQLHEIHMHAKYQVAIFNIAKVMANVKVFGRRLRRGRTSWLWQYLGFSSKTAELKTRDVFVRNTMPHHSKCAAPWDTHACQISNFYLEYCKSYDQTLTKIKVFG